MVGYLLSLLHNLPSSAVCPSLMILVIITSSVRNSPVRVPGGIADELLAVGQDPLGDSIIQYHTVDGTALARVAQRPPLAAHGRVHDGHALVLLQG